MNVISDEPESRHSNKNCVIGLILTAKPSCKFNCRRYHYLCNILRYFRRLKFSLQIDRTFVIENQQCLIVVDKKLPRLSLNYHWENRYSLTVQIGLKTLFQIVTNLVISYLKVSVKNQSNLSFSINSNTFFSKTDPLRTIPDNIKRVFNYFLSETSHPIKIIV